MKLPLRYYIITLILSLLPLVVCSTTLLSLAENEIKSSAVKLLIQSAEADEGAVFAFMDKNQARVSDWASDNHVRELTMQLIAGTDPQIASQLGQYITSRKLTLDRTVTSSAVLSKEGKILASSRPEEVGSTLAVEVMNVVKTSNESPGNTDQPFTYEDSQGPTIHFFVPIRSNADDSITGYLVNRVSAKELGSILSGERQVAMGALPGSGLSRGVTAETLLISRETRNIIVSSRFTSPANATATISTAPVTSCLKSGFELSGTWKDYRGINVYGASMCPRNSFYILVSKLDAAEVDEGINSLRRIIDLISAAFALINIFSLAYMQTLLDKRFETECNVFRNKKVK